MRVGIRLEVAEGLAVPLTGGRVALDVGVRVTVAVELAVWLGVGLAAWLAVGLGETATASVGVVCAPQPVSEPSPTVKIKSKAKQVLRATESMGIRITFLCRSW